MPNLCPNTIHVDALDFSECHSEEVIKVSFDAQCTYYIDINLQNTRGRRANRPGNLKSRPGKKNYESDFLWKNIKNRPCDCIRP